MDVCSVYSNQLGSRCHLKRYGCKRRQMTASKFQIDMINAIFIHRTRERERESSEVSEAHRAHVRSTFIFILKLHHLHNVRSNNCACEAELRVWDVIASTKIENKCWRFNDKGKAKASNQQLSYHRFCVCVYVKDMIVHKHLYTDAQNHRIINHLLTHTMINI